MTPFVRFPRTPHLWAPDGADVRADKVLSPAAAERFMDSPVVVEEKLDGENLGLSVVDGRLAVQSRGSYVELGGSLFRGLEAWLRPRAERLAGELSDDLVLFGEWCATRHTATYDRLPDWLLVFDVFDRRRGGFWPLDERDLLGEALGLVPVPRLAAGRFDRRGLERLIATSRVGSGPMEGLVLRRSARPDERAKVVAPAFLTGIDEHWRRRAPVPNRLAIATPG